MSSRWTAAQLNVQALGKLWSMPRDLCTVPQCTGKLFGSDLVKQKVAHNQKEGIAATRIRESEVSGFKYWCRREDIFTFVKNNLKTLGHFICFYVEGLKSVELMNYYFEKCNLFSKNK